MFTALGLPLMFYSYKSMEFGKEMALKANYDYQHGLSDLGIAAIYGFGVFLTMLFVEKMTTPFFYRNCKEQDNKA